MLTEGKKGEEDEEEFLVIASRFAITESKVISFQRGAKGRIILYAAIAVDNGRRMVDVFHTHFGLEAPDHCVNVMDIWETVNRYHILHPDRLQILLGDFNTYLDWEYPMDFLTVNHGDGHNKLLMQFLESKCEAFSQMRNRTHINGQYPPFIDVWKEIYGKDIDVMKTFTNFEDERIEDPTVADRILYRNGISGDSWNVCDVWIAGDQPFSIKVGEKEVEQVFPSDHRTVITKLFMK